MDQRGFYSTTLYSTQKYVVTRDSSKPVGKYVIDELVENDNPTKKDYLEKFIKSYAEDFSLNYLFNHFKWSYLNNEVIN